MGEDETIASHSFEHLSCFFPGLLTLGVHLLPLNNLEVIGIDFTQLGDSPPLKQCQGYHALVEFDLADLHLWAAKGMAPTCYLAYADQLMGLGPHGVIMLVSSPPGVADKPPWVGVPKVKTEEEQEICAIIRDYNFTNSDYNLRPEPVESFYILWRSPGDVRWRHRGWYVFQAVEHVNASRSTGSMPRWVPGLENKFAYLPASGSSSSGVGYFLAETLKYLYLLFLDEDTVPLEKWVFNTEAHPLPVCSWTESDKEVYPGDTDRI